MPADAANRVTERIRAAQIHALYRAVSIAVVGASAGAVVLSASVIGSGAAGAPRAVTWCAGVCFCAICHLLLRRRRAAMGGEDWRQWGRRFVLIALAEGLLWGGATVGMVGPEHYPQQIVVVLAAYALAVGSIAAFGSYMPAVWCFFLSATVPFALDSLFAGGDAQIRMVGIMAVFYIVTMTALARRANGEFVEGLRLRFEMEDLARELQAQKEIAEEASVAKSRFLAAASHDLRQPVHALTLYLGAIQGLELAPRARALVGHIESSVATLDGLFTALLDISRLDAAVVTPEPAGFALAPLLERVCRDLRGEADAKGLALRLVPCSLAVWTDPLLFERIVRNLIANAVRHTRQGRVLVGVRRTDQAHLRVEVWDTGPGIPPALREKVFEEFFQIGNQARDREMGLGLGLAIVRRLTRLLGIELSLRSVEEHGSAFSLTVTRHELLPLAMAVLPRVDPVAPQCGMILVIDDEPAVMRGMDALLSGWGYTVRCASSGAEMLHILADCSIRPDLLICDYRLRDGEDGLATIRMLQAEYNDDLPAILVTGDTAPGRLAEASASGLAVLHKPVAHTRLRAAVNAALTADAAAPAPPQPVSG